MRFHYVSPSLLPSRAANAVHVVLQCDALARNGADVTLYAKRSTANASDLVHALADSYGVDASSWRLVTYHSRFSRADTLRIAVLAARDIARGPRPEIVLSRNLYAAYYLAVVMRHPLLFELHHPERGMRKAIQETVVRSPRVTTVAISDALARNIAANVGVPPKRTVVLRDAAPQGMQRVAPSSRRALLTQVIPGVPQDWKATCAYFGHLYAGKGIETIEALADARPDVGFLVFGGNEAELALHRAANHRRNLLFVGHVPHPIARQAMTVVDILLMPYQAHVSIGSGGHDTAQWMSPMKMFEYLAAGVPIISSDLPVLAEVLTDHRNALLVPPDRPEAWVAALDELIADPALANKLGEAGHTEYLTRYTWDHRARALLAAAERF